MKIDDVLTLVSVLFMIVLGIIAQTWAIIRWFNNKVDSRHEHHSSEIAKVNERIDEVKDNYVRRSDLDRDLKSLASSIDQLQITLNQSLESTNTRLEAYMRSSNARLDKILLAVSSQRST